jgi:hypothetical protein
METSVWIILLVVALLVGALIAWLAMQRKRSDRLRNRFGVEYDHTLETAGNRRHAEAELEQRQKRVSTFDIRPLDPADRDRFSHRWLAIQARFVDEPTTAIVEADELLTDVMRLRGYPTGDFEQRAADLSVDHPQFVDHYRAANTIKAQRGQGQATTEDLRQALIHYRALFDHLIEDQTAERVEVRR